MEQNVEFIPSICEIREHMSETEVKEFVRYLIDEGLDVAFLNGDRV